MPRQKSAQSFLMDYHATSGCARANQHTIPQSAPRLCRYHDLLNNNGFTLCDADH